MEYKTMATFVYTWGAYFKQEKSITSRQFVVGSVQSSVGAQKCALKNF